MMACHTQWARAGFPRLILKTDREFHLAPQKDKRAKQKIEALMQLILG